MKNTCFAFTVFVCCIISTSPAWGQVEYVVHISVDGLRPDAITTLGASGAPNFYRFRTEGAFTDNARVDHDSGRTLPNHVDILTGRRILSSVGHNYEENSTPPSNVTLATNKGSYVAGVFDVAHDNGLSTGLYAGKDKLKLFNQSWNATTGALDITGIDNGRDKIDHYYYSSNSTSITNAFLSEMQSSPLNYSFVHFPNPDSAGHTSGWYPWLGTPYSNSVKTVDGHLGSIFNFIENNPLMAGKTAVILTADHGGADNDHGTSNIDSYTIPFYVWGPGVAAGADLYDLNLASRLDPLTYRPTFSPLEPGQPIRNGDSPNLALEMLGLGAIPGSTINNLQDLEVAVTPCNLVADIAPVGAPDGIVDGADLGAMLARWKTNDPLADIAPLGAPDGIVDGTDLGALLARWKNTCLTPPPPAIPEPATLALLSMGAVALMRRKR